MIYPAARTFLALAASSAAWIAAGSAFSLHPALAEERYLETTAYLVPPHTTSEQSGYFSLVEGSDGRIYLGTAKYGSNAYLVAFDPRLQEMEVVVDCMKEIGSEAKGFAAQAKIHTRNNVGASGKIYFGTKQGYPKEGERRSDYAGGHAMVYDPAIGDTRVYRIPVPHHGIISIVPDESRGVAYISTCDDARPIESTHFMVLDLETGEYRDLMDCRHLYAFLVLDARGRAYHPVLGGGIARFDPAKNELKHLTQSIDGEPPAAETLLATAEGHPINWDASPARDTLYAVPMSYNGLFAYDLTAEGRTLPGTLLGKLLPRATKFDCRALCTASDGTVWAGAAARFEDGDAGLRLISYKPGDGAPVDRGRVVIGNPDYTRFTDENDKAKPWHHGVERLADGRLAPRYHIMAICAARDGTVYFTTLYPFTLHAWKPEKP